MSELSPHLKDLNPEQFEAVCHGEGPLLVFAGAGSGKTRVLTRRIAHLAIEHRVEPERILAVTFTNKAAREMKERVATLFGRRTVSLWVSTFHSSCVRILRQNAKLLDYTSNFAIYDANDTLSALKRVYKKLKIDPKVIDPRSVRSRIDTAKNNYLFPDSFREDTSLPGSIAETIADIFEAYQEELHQSNAMDFGDLLCNVVTLFKLESRVLESYQNRFQHLLVDEYQDTNKVQYMLVQMLSAKNKNICVVGDDDQSIYAFRGANVENILHFKKDFPGAKTITLETNYRSTKNILETANSVISENRHRQEKNMNTPNPKGDPIVTYCGYNEREEAEFVTQEIISVLGKNQMKPSQIAIFYRTNAQSRAIEELFCECSIPYEIFGGHRFYDRKEIKDILAYFRLVLNPNDNEAFLRIINTPPRGLGSSSIGNLIAFANEREASLFSSLKEGLLQNAPFISSANKKNYSKFLALMEKLKKEAADTQKILQTPAPDIPEIDQISALSLFLQTIAEDSGYLSKLKGEDTPEAEARVENIYELFAVAQEFVSRALNENSIPSLTDFLDRTSLSSDIDKEGSEKDNKKATDGSVSLSTLHLAKGLEFDMVFLIGMEEGLLPHIHSIDDETALEEERRLCYVGITRAKERLFVTRATNRSTFGRQNWFAGEPSRFLHDFPKKLIDSRGGGLLEDDWYTARE